MSRLGRALACASIYVHVHDTTYAHHCTYKGRYKKAIVLATSHDLFTGYNVGAVVSTMPGHQSQQSINSVPYYLEATRAN